MDERLPEQYEVLFRKAVSDVSLAFYGFKANDKNIDSAALHFHLHQGVEKLIKALLAYNKIHFEKTHDLKLLLKICRENEIRLPEYVEELKALNPFAVLERYDLLDYANNDFERYHTLVDRFLNEVKGFLGI